MKQTQPDKKKFVLRDRNGDLGKPWYISFKESGKRIRRYGNINRGKTGEERKKLAKRLIRALKKEHKQLPASIDLREKIYDALEFERPQLRKKSYQTYRSKIGQLFEWLGNDPLTTDSLRLYFKLYRQFHTQTGTYDARRMLMTFFKKSNLAYLLDPGVQFSMIIYSR